MALGGSVGQFCGAHWNFWVIVWLVNPKRLGSGDWRGQGGEEIAGYRLWDGVCERGVAGGLFGVLGV